MVTRFASTDRALPTAVLCGGAYAVGVLLWAFATGVRFTTDSPTAVAIALGYSALGMFLLAAVPVYLLGRVSLLSPVLAAAWSLGNTAYLRWYVPRPHDALASYLTVWPLLFGIVVAVAVVEFAVRTGTERLVGRFGPRSLF